MEQQYIKNQFGTNDNKLLQISQMESIAMQRWTLTTVENTMKDKNYLYICETDDENKDSNTTTVWQISIIVL